MTLFVVLGVLVDSVVVASFVGLGSSTTSIRCDINSAELSSAGGCGNCLGLNSSAPSSSCLPGGLESLIGGGRVEACSREFWLLVEAGSNGIDGEGSAFGLNTCGMTVMNGGKVDSKTSGGNSLSSVLLNETIGWWDVDSKRREVVVVGSWVGGDLKVRISQL